MFPSPLMRPVSWPVQPGASAVPGLRRAGEGLLLAIALFLLAWLLTLAHDVWRGVEGPWRLLPAALVCLLGLRHVWRVAQTWRRVRPHVTLAWSGALMPAQTTSRQRGRESQGGGWRIDLWGDQPVKVQIVADWQYWVLLKAMPVKPDGMRPTHLWFWLNLRTFPDSHRLRTLLHLSPRLTTPAEGRPAPESRPMASWAAKETPGVVLPTSSSPLFPPLRRQRVMSPSRPLTSEFAPTEIQSFSSLADDHRKSR